MKLIFTILLSSLLVNAKAQSSSSPYNAQPELKKFAGIWQCVLGDTTFTINLKFVKKYVKAPGDFYMDVIQGDYTIKKGNQILQSSNGESGINVGVFVNKKVSKDKIKLLFYDLGRKLKSGLATFELVNGRADEANWVLNNQEGVHIGHYDYSFSVPTQAIFKKVN